MNYSEYYKARDTIEKIMREDLLGPVTEDEILAESPVSYYLLGKLYPRNILQIEDEEVFVEENENSFAEEELLALGNGQYPSAMGITFALDRSTSSFGVSVKVAYYELQQETKSWKRHVIEHREQIQMQDLFAQPIQMIPVHGKLQLMIHLYQYALMDHVKITATLVNNSISANYSYEMLSAVTYFQPELIVDSVEGGSFCELMQRNVDSENEENKELELLYHETKNYAIGHGCSADWMKDEHGEIRSVYLTVIPEYELLQMQPANCISGKLLSMKFLAHSRFQEFQAEFSGFVKGYETWIRQMEQQNQKLDVDLQTVGQSNLGKCRASLVRLKKAVEVLQDSLAWRAFQYANETMLNQRKCMVKGIADDKITWYPFQLAFFVQEIESIVNPNCTDRKTVDLLWFPTGGGKTEAYLGIAAFTIFYRRLREMKNNQNDLGVAVIMRYTLRLLSFQQFERASSMICAAEMIRRRDRLGETEFGIALWAGRDLTPNTLKDAEDYLYRNKRSEISNPVQVTKCPWCGERLTEQNYAIDRIRKRMLISCPNRGCSFHEGLPIHLVDEDIYEHKPSFLIGTVDKFARVAFKEEAGELLGCRLPQPPELIIQDELHLISGPLGTITGIYEAAITKLCEKNGVKPKIIASTATIRNAQNQIKALYGMDYAQFPPQGLSINDSYFAILSQKDTKPARKYMGYLSAGSSRAVTFVRVVGALLFASRYLTEAGYSEEVVDAFWTETGYFNTLRELGSAMIRIIDNVQDRYQYLKNTKFVDRYPIRKGEERYSQIYEMTSRRSSSDLGAAIQEVLMKPYKADSKQYPLDFLIASNMISVGVDVARLNNMVVVGQPMKTSEYIQSTSRVGRSTPGLVMVLYHPALSRDRSHYEAFVQFHSSLYKYVEATSLTPFADRARDRALQALYIILCRYMVPSLTRNEDAKNYRRDIPQLEQVRNYIYDYVQMVDPEELENVMEEITEIEIEWDNRASHADKLVYSDYLSTEHALYKPDYQEGNRFRMMNSMRSVEPSVEVSTVE